MKVRTPYIYQLLLVMVSFIMLSACSASKKLGTSGLERDSPEFLIKAMATNQVNAKWFSARAKVDFAGDDMSVGATATIRMLKDSLIWVSVRKLGFEVMRAKITQDSVYIIDRLGNTYDIKDLNYLQKTYNVPASLEMLQAIVLGNPVFFSTSGFQTEKVEPLLHLFGKSARMDTHYWLDKKDYRLQKMSFEEPQDQRLVQMQLEDYQQLADNQNFSYFRILEMNSRETGKVKVEMKYSQLEINIPKDVEFEIPDRYTRSSY
ncbi:MAG: DUF4292 domain-containing protein [Saprospiraceae bacterium]|nr:DUF4292 domain-containing protein [Saprospiraceae bacterium]